MIHGPRARHVPLHWMNILFVIWFSEQFYKFGKSISSEMSWIMLEYDIGKCLVSIVFIRKINPPNLWNDFINFQSQIC